MARCQKIKIANVGGRVWLDKRMMALELWVGVWGTLRCYVDKPPKTSHSAFCNCPFLALSFPECSAALDPVEDSLFTQVFNFLGSVILLLSGALTFSPQFFSLPTLLIQTLVFQRILPQPATHLPPNTLQWVLQNLRFTSLDSIEWGFKQITWCSCLFLWLYIQISNWHSYISVTSVLIFCYYLWYHML